MIFNAFVNTFLSSEQICSFMTSFEKNKTFFIKYILFAFFYFQGNCLEFPIRLLHVSPVFPAGFDLVLPIMGHCLQLRKLELLFFFSFFIHQNLISAMCCCIDMWPSNIPECSHLIPNQALFIKQFILCIQ